MKTTFRSTTLQAIMRTALLFTVLLSFPATIMAFEETLVNGADKFKYFLSGEVVNEGELWSSGIKRSNMVFNQNINIPIHIKAEKISGKSKNFSINVQTYFFTNGKEKKGPSFSVDTGKFEERIDIPKGTTTVRVYINYLGHTVKYLGNQEYKEYSEFNVEAKYEVTGTIVEETAPQPWSTEEEPHCHQTDSHIRFNDYYGEVKIRCDFEEDDSYEFVDLNTVIYEYDRIKTEDDSGAILGLEDMSTYVIKPESILIIHTEEDKTSRLELIVGAIVGNWKKMLQGKSIECEMSQCVAGISGTIVAFEETGKESRVWLLAGAVYVKSKKTGKVTKLKPGQRSVTGTNGVVQVKSFNIEEGAKKFGISMDDIKNHYSNGNGNAPTAAQTGNTINDVAPNGSSLAANPTTIKLTFSADTLFEQGKYVILDSRKNVLKNLAGLLNNEPDLLIVVQGHTDSSGNAKKDDELSLKQARAIADFLIKSGVSSSRFEKISGFGSRQPITDNSTKAGRKENRRVEIYLYKKVN